ncbi:hypothetical protein K470DRAFT_261384 [Piedraia hortae CBS 480.64]|uniref:Secreted protein n=1 Tax=Piedraia hortae CBS 480.64 TaxID=1314780 RepID=A0A6A7CDV6_9PEZI|nr:hypothetical protein K470DRAFT_261384 [Piedraia hortae CBS 480.64]
MTTSCLMALRPSMFLSALAVLTLTAIPHAQGHGWACLGLGDTVPHAPAVATGSSSSAPLKRPHGRSTDVARTVPKNCSFCHTSGCCISRNRRNISEPVDAAEVNISEQPARAARCRTRGHISTTATFHMANDYN